MKSEDPYYVFLYKHTKALLVALGQRDLLTRLHSERVLCLCEVIGMSIGLSSKELSVLKLAGGFHDLGKIGIPDAILMKSSKFEEAEWEIMKQHAEKGEQIMAATEIEGLQQVALVIRHHHEHYNGKGYPDNLSAEAIPISSRIISIADSYDALAATRSYHRGRTHTQIMDILQSETGAKHDPGLMQTFCEVIKSSEFRATTA